MKEIVLKVNGMMCGGCENRVKNTVGSIEGVKNVTANHITGEVSVTAMDDVSKEIIKESLDDIGYEVIGE